MVTHFCKGAACLRRKEKKKHTKQNMRKSETKS